MSCFICVEEYTKQPHKKQAKCPHCDIQACVKCTQTYLLGTHEDPHCMGCRKAWTREVMDSILLTTWINGDYKKHRENILFDRERSRLPAAQIVVERRKKAAEREPIRLDIMNKIRVMEADLVKLRGDYYQECRLIDMYQRGEDPHSASSETKEERKVFVMPCPANGCRGFLSQAYKCGVCDIFACPECREVKGGARDSDHTCNPDTVATVQRLKKECRGCPECGTNIFKIEGCDQMFCTNCNTPFSWTTGKKVTNGAIHNPHYFEYLRAANGGVMPRNPGDIPCIGNLPNAWTFERDIRRRYTAIPKDIYEFLYYGLNTIAHIQHVEIPHTTNHAEDNDNTEVNVKYLTNSIDQVKWKQALQQKEKKRIKKDELRMRYEAFVGACVDIYGRIIAVERGHRSTTPATPLKVSEIEAMNKVCADAYHQLQALRKIFNDGLMEISKRYKCQVIYLAEIRLKRETTKYDTGRKRKAADTASETASSIGRGQDTDEDDNVVVSTGQ